MALYAKMAQAFHRRLADGYLKIKVNRTKNLVNLVGKIRSLTIDRQAVNLSGFLDILNKYAVTGENLQTNFRF